MYDKLTVKLVGNIQSENINGSLSKWRDLSNEIPYGSVPGQLLFSI